MTTNFYLMNGLKIRPANSFYHDAVEIEYNGLLPSSGATEVFAHIGFDDEWKSTQDYRMNRTDQGFKTSVILPADTDTLSICFRDAAGNWDNNSGSNYNFVVDSRDGRPELKPRASGFTNTDLSYGITDSDLI